MVNRLHNQICTEDVDKKQIFSSHTVSISDFTSDAANDAINLNHPLLASLTEFKPGQHPVMIGFSNFKAANRLIKKERVDLIKDSFYEAVFPILRRTGAIYIPEYKSFFYLANKEEEQKRSTDPLYQKLQEVLDEKTVEYAGLEHKGIISLEVITGEILDYFPESSERSVLAGLQRMKNQMEHRVKGVKTIKEFNPFSLYFRVNSYSDETLEAGNAYIKDNYLYLKSREDESFSAHLISINGILSKDIVQMFIDRKIPFQLELWEKINKGLLTIDYDSLFSNESMTHEGKEYNICGNTFSISSLDPNEPYYIQHDLVIGGLTNKELFQYLKDEKLPEGLKLTETIKKLKAFASIHGEVIMPVKWSGQGKPGNIAGYSLSEIEAYKDGKLDDRYIHENHKGVISETAFIAKVMGRSGLVGMSDMRGLGNSNAHENLDRIKNYVEEESISYIKVLDESGSESDFKMYEFLELLKARFPDGSFIFAGGDEAGYYIESNIINVPELNLALRDFGKKVGLSFRTFLGKKKVTGALTHMFEDKYTEISKDLEKVFAEYEACLQGEISFYLKNHIDGVPSSHDILIDSINRTYPYAGSANDTFALCDDLKAVDELNLYLDNLQQLSNFTIIEEDENVLVCFGGNDRAMKLNKIFDANMNFLNGSPFFEMLDTATRGLYIYNKKAA